ncbi:MAG: hypothetical protein AAF098_06385 [Pseudomonadota bacterium]
MLRPRAAGYRPTLSGDGDIPGRRLEGVYRSDSVHQISEAEPFALTNWRAPKSVEQNNPGFSGALIQRKLRDFL